MDETLINQLYSIVMGRVKKCEKNGECDIYCKGPILTKPNGTQYGRVSKVVNGKEMKAYAHRVSKLYHSVDVPEHIKKLPCSHLCHNGLCVNPSHIVFELDMYNNQRKICKGRKEGCIGHVDQEGNPLPNCIIFE